MKKRLTFACWHCQKEYTLLREPDGATRLLVQCPFCEKEAVVDLLPYRSPTDIFKSIDTPQGNTGETLVLPAVLPTTEPKAEE